MAEVSVAKDADTDRCAICGKPYPLAKLRPLGAMTHGTVAALHAEHPSLTPDALICRDDRARYRRRAIEDLLERERGALSTLDHEVLDSLQSGMPITEPPEETWSENRTIGDRASDAIARFGGSWTFILSFIFVLTVWMAINATGLLFGIFDPYPFILLNLALSTVAALQAPVIMMSQGRQAEKDRLHADNDYKVNLKAEIEIRHLHDKIDTQLMRQWDRLMAIQRLQLELLEETTRGAQEDGQE
jgi:uncharacterized membrane protein